jgi:hypothetical protein
MDAASRYASISADGRWIAFFSDASNLIANDTNGAPDVFLADANNLASPPERISVVGAGNQINGPSRPLSPNAVSADDRYVVFAVDTPVSIDGSNPNTLEDVFLRDRQTGTTSLISKRTDGPAQRRLVELSRHLAGRSLRRLIAVFDSSATNLLDGGDTHAAPDVFVVVPEPGATGAAVAALGLLSGLARRGLIARPSARLRRGRRPRVSSRREHGDPHDGGYVR